MELREGPWVVWKPAITPESKIAKKPVDWRDPYGMPVNPLDPLHQCTFEQAVEVMQSDPTFGIGMVLTRERRTLCFDEDKVTPGGRELLASMHQNCPSWSQQSITGRGTHSFWVGTIPYDRQSIYRDDDGIQIFAHSQFMAMTGIPVSRDHPIAQYTNGHIADGSPMFDQMFSSIEAPVASVIAAGDWTIPAIAELLSFIGADCDQKTWTAVVGGLLTETGGSEEGFQLANDWSASYPGKYPGVSHMQNMWRRFQKKAGTSGIGNICWHAKGRGADISAIMIKHGVRQADQSVARSLVFATGTDEPTLDVPEPRFDVPEPPARQDKDEALKLLDQLIALNQPIEQCIAEIKRQGFLQTDEELRMAHRVAKRDLVIITNHAPMDHARKFMKAKCMWGTASLLKYWRGAFYFWNSIYYEAIADDSIRSKIWHFLDGAVVAQRDKDTGKICGYTHFVASSNSVSQAIDALKAISGTPDADTPIWLVKTTPITLGKEFLSFKNGLLHLGKNVMIKSNPYYFNTGATDVAYDPVAKKPVEWMKFLRSLWPDDPDSISCLQEIFGYLLSSDTSQQKIFAFVGPKRSGKGTILRVLGALIGQGYTTTNMQQLSSQFGLEGMVTKSVCAIPDASLSGRTDSVQVAETLKTISGEDPISVPQKFKQAWVGQLGVRFVMAANEVLSIQDRSGALASRLIMLQLEYSFLGREDRALGSRLVAELSGILLWAIDGLRRLEERGNFTQPATGQEAVDTIAKLGSHVINFVDDCCELHEDAVSFKNELYVKWVAWHSSNNLKPGSQSWFCRDLKSAYPELKSVRPQHTDGKQYWAFKGIRIKD